MTNPTRELVFARSEGVCQCEGACGLHEERCTAQITYEIFHKSHLRARTHGGIDHESNLEAWCSRCNLTLQARDARDTRLAPREWQLRELDKIVGQIMRTGAATLSAAPGAGKTVFAGLVFEALRDAGYIERMMVVVPRRGLCEQWVDALHIGRHIQLRPHSAIERLGQQEGVVVTYQSLPNRDQLDTHILRAKVPTLLVLDEVHHLARDAQGTHRAWGNAITELAGDVESANLNVAGVLNLSGTLWRSDPSERISTVRYTPPDANGQIMSLVDGEATVQELIQIGELRSVDLYRVDAQVRVADHQNLTFIEGNLADIDREVAAAAIRTLADINSWRTAFVASVLDRLERAHEHLSHHHVKALIVAASQDQAALFRNEVDRQMRQRGLPPLAALAISRDEDEAQRTLENFRAQKRVGVLCTVDMAGEGYDCPDIVVLGYASNKLTELYVRQVTARAMRVTDREREAGALLPAVVVLPDSPKLVETFLSYLRPALHDVRLEEEPRRREGIKDGDGPRLRRFVLDSAVPGRETVTVSFLDGTHENVDAEYMSILAEHLVAVNMPEIFWPRATAVMQRTGADLLRQRPFDHPDPEQQQQQQPVTVPASDEQQAMMLQTRLSRLGGWWHNNGDIPVAHFNRLANEAGGIRDGERPNASIAQLERAITFADRYIRDYRRRRGMENN